MQELSDKLTLERVEQEIEKYCWVNNINIDELFMNSYLVEKFFKSYVPELFYLSDTQYVDFLLEVDQSILSVMVAVRKVKLDHLSFMKLYKRNDSILKELLDNNPGLLDKELMQIMLEEYKGFSPCSLLFKLSKSGYLSNDIVLDASLDYMIKNNCCGAVELEFIFNTVLSDNFIIKLFSSIDFSNLNVPANLLSNELVIKTIIASGHRLPSNVEQVPINVINSNVDLIVDYLKKNDISENALNIMGNPVIIEECIKEGIFEKKFYDKVSIECWDELVKKIDLIVDFFKVNDVPRNALNIMKNFMIIGRCIRENPFRKEFYDKIDESCIGILENNISQLVAQGVNPNDLINNVTSKSVVFFEKLWTYDNLGSFSVDLIVNNFDILVKSNFDVDLLPADSLLLRSNEFVKKIIDYQRENNMEISVINKATKEAVLSNIMYALNAGYYISMKSPQFILDDREFLSYYLDIQLAKVGNHKPKIIELGNMIGADNLAIIFGDLLSNESFISAFSVQELLQIVKFIYFAGDMSRENLIKIIKSDSIDNFKMIYNLLKEGSYFDIKFYKIINDNYLKFSNLCKNFVVNNYTKDDCSLLYKILVNGNQQASIISNLGELRNYKKIVYDNNNKNMEDISMNNLMSDEVKIKSIKNIILLMLCNKNYEEINKLLISMFSSNKISDLLATIKDENVKYELENYLVFIKFIEAIVNNNDFDNLKNIAVNLNERLLNDDKSLLSIWYEFKDIEKKAKCFYAIELNEKVVNFSQLETAEGVIRENSKLKADIDNIDGEALVSEEVDYIELEGMPYVSLVHVMNAYGSGAKLSDFRHPRLIGRSYICLSAISDDKSKIVDYKGDIDINHVALMFSNFSNNQLVLEANCDINSNGENNSLEISSIVSNFEPVRKLIKDTNSAYYNEYVMYREDENGQSIYPSAVFVMGDEPNQYEINAAAYLGVPLVKINKKAYKNRKNEEEKREEKKAAVVNNSLIEKYKELSSDLKQLQQYITIVSEEDKRGVSR